jgi:hypothetical protein
MKIQFGVAALIISFFAIGSSALAESDASDKNLGVGCVIGAPTALSVRYNAAADHSFDAQLSFNSRNYMLLYGDYLFLFKDVFQSDEKFVQQLTPYVGIGPLLAIATRKNHDTDNYFDRSDTALAIAARIPFGIEWRYDKIPLGIGIEAAPGIVIIPSTMGFLQAGMTFRFYF